MSYAPLYRTPLYGDPTSWQALGLGAIAGTASTTLAFTGSSAASAGTVDSEASALGFVELLGSSLAAATASGQAGSALAFTGSSAASVGTAGREASALGTVELLGASSAAVTIAAAASSVVALSGGSLAGVELHGEAEGSFALTGVALGTALLGVQGTASGELAITGTANNVAITILFNPDALLYRTTSPVFLERFHAAR